MRCPACHHPESRVIDSRTTGDAIRRRRSCQSCGHRFSTLEKVELRLPWVLKKDGRREPFSSAKLLDGLTVACRKRPVDRDALEAAVRDVEHRLTELRVADVSSAEVGRIVMEVLRGIDAVAYVRFASVYREFESVEQFTDAILPLRDDG
ncbi:MAG: transcriptional regulator NrdR [Myxococcales bacterium]|nr:transcriptional regulator NrdR [Myxococcales bacterium]